MEVVWLRYILSFVDGITASSLRYTSYINFINVARYIAYSGSCTTTKLSKLLTSCLTVIKNHILKYCATVYERNGKT